MRESAGIATLRRELGERLATFRKAAGVTQAELAASVFCDRTRVAHLERGRGGADERFWSAADRALAADGFLIRAEREFRSAVQAASEQRREQERATARAVIDGWRGDDTEALVAHASALDWLDVHAGWRAGTSRGKVATIMREPGSLAWRSDQRVRVGRADALDALVAYYGEDGLFSASIGPTSVRTSILTRPEWTGLAYDALRSSDQLSLRSGTGPEILLDEDMASKAVARIAASIIGQVRLVDVPIYRLLDIRPGAGTVGLASFLDYALTMDMLESELLDAVAGGAPMALPLRDRLLRDRTAVLDVGSRVCAGGPLALCAIARSDDYVVLVQQRSAHVLNAGRRLSVIPKGFHQPLVDYRGEAGIGHTLLRELEEELFGRSDVDSTAGPQRAAGPMHPGRLSQPLRWLLERPDRMRVECTGFGLNLVSGNYEFAGLIVIDDEEFWPRFGGVIEANWESGGLRQYSTNDADLLAELAADESWSNEGLFALLLGLCRLRELDPARVDVQVTQRTATARS